MDSHSRFIFSLLLMIPGVLISGFLVSAIPGMNASAEEATQTVLKAAFPQHTVWNLYPSPDPLSHAFLVDWTSDHTEVAVYDLKGNLVPVEISIQHTPDVWQYQIGANLSPGLYILQMRSGNEIGYAKLAMTL